MNGEGLVILEEQFMQKHKHKRIAAFHLKVTSVNTIVVNNPCVYHYYIICKNIYRS